MCCLPSIWYDYLDCLTPVVRRRIQRLSTGIEDVNFLNWELALSLAVSWFVCYLCVLKGVRSSGKVEGRITEFKGPQYTFELA